VLASLGHGNIVETLLPFVAVAVLVFVAIHVWQRRRGPSTQEPKP